MWGAMVDAIKHAHDETVGRGLDAWQTNYLDRKIQNRTAELNKDLWKYQMSNAYQLTVDDMRKAGLNPIMAFGQGATSASGHATSASGYSSNRSNNWSPSQSLVNAKQMNLLDSQIATQQATAKQIAQATEKLRQETRVIERDNQHWDKNPDQYGIKKGQETIPWIGGIGQLLGEVTDRLATSAKSFNEMKMKEGRSKRYLYTGQYGDDR